MKGLNLRGVTEFCRVLVREPQLLLPQVSVTGACKRPARGSSRLRLS